MDQDSLLRDSVVLIFTTLASGFLAYSYQVIVGNLLTPTLYGIFATLFSMSYIYTFFSESLKKSVIREFPEIKREKRSDALQSITKKAGIITVVVVGISLVFIPLFQSLFGIQSYLLFVLIIAISGVDIVNSTQFGAIRAQEQFLEIGVVNIIGEVVKLTIGVSLIVLGFQVLGAIGAALLSGLVVFWMSRYVLRLDLGLPTSKDSQEQILHRLPYTGLIALCFTLPTNIDVLIVKANFSPHTAGVYAAIVVFGKIILFLGNGISGAMLPKATKQKKGAWKLLAKSISYCVFLSVGILSIYILFPDTIVSTIFGQNYIEGAQILGLYALFSALLAISKILLDYSLAVNDIIFPSSYLLIMLGSYGYIFISVSQLTSVIKGQIVFSAVAIILGVGIISIKEHPRVFVDREPI